MNNPQRQIDPQAVRFKAMIEEAEIPDYMRQSVFDYVAHGFHPGSFLGAIMANDLVHAAAAADSENQHCLFAYACLLYNLPSICWGSEELVNKWCEHHGFAGIDQRKD